MTFEFCSLSQRIEQLIDVGAVLQFMMILTLNQQRTQPDSALANFINLINLLKVSILTLLSSTNQISSYFFIRSISSSSQAGLAKTRVFQKNPTHLGFLVLWFFYGFCFFSGFFGIFDFNFFSLYYINKTAIKKLTFRYQCIVIMLKSINISLTV